MRQVEAVFPAGSWRKSTYSGSQGSCVEVASAPEVTGVRDTKNRDNGALLVHWPAWRALIERV